MATSTRPQKGKTAAESLITGAAIAAAFVLLNVLTCGARARLDLTEHNIYSLSDASRNAVAGMTERVNIKGYFGNVPAEHAEKMNYVDMLLAEYAERSNGKVTYEKIDPWDKPELQEEIRKDGVEKLRLQSMKDDSFEQVPMYFHVVFSHLDKKEVWTPAQGFALEGLEYDFTTRIRRLGFGKKKVGVTTGFGEPAETQILSAPGADVLPGVKVGLGDLYEVSPIDWSKEPKKLADMDVIIVNGPTEKVSDAAKYHLDQAIMKGKPVLFLVSGMRWQTGGGQQQIPGMEQPDQPYLGMTGDNGLDDLLSTYGFEVGKNVILDLRNSARGWIPPGSRQGMLARGVFPYAKSLQGGDKGMLAGIEVIPAPFASTLKLVGALASAGAEGDTKVLKLLETSPTSWARSDLLAITRELELKADDKAAGPFLVGAAASATFKSLYADKPVPEGVDLTPAPPAEGEAAAPAAPAGTAKESVAHTRIIVLSAPAMAADTTLTDIRSHGDIVYVNGFVALHNLVDWLAEDTDLIAVRSKKPERPIARLETGKRTLVKYANVVGAPLLLVLIGVVFWRLRERRRRHIRL